LTLASNASNGSVSEAFSGSGTTPVQHSVALKWNASTSSGVVGYNVYRSGQSGGPYAKINSSLIPSTTNTDTNVQSGSTYYYVVTAVDSSGRESLFSNQVQAVIP
jgi:fibronectin type 3 domain-containing protein